MVGCVSRDGCWRAATELILIDLLRSWLGKYQDACAPWLRVSLVLAWAGLIWFSSSQSGIGFPQGPFYSVLWNSAHVGIFGVLAALIVLSTQGCTARQVCFAIVATSVYGVIDELHQNTVEGRVMDRWDACSDALGGCIAACTVFWLLTGRNRVALWLVLLVPLAAGSVLMAAS